MTAIDTKQCKTNTIDRLRVKITATILNDCAISFLYVPLIALWCYNAITVKISCVTFLISETRDSNIESLASYFKIKAIWPCYRLNCTSYFTIPLQITTIHNSNTATFVRNARMLFYL